MYKGKDSNFCKYLFYCFYQIVVDYYYLLCYFQNNQWQKIYKTHTQKIYRLLFLQIIRLHIIYIRLWLIITVIIIILIQCKTQDHSSSWRMACLTLVGAAVFLAQLSFSSFSCSVCYFLVSASTFLSPAASAEDHPVSSFWSLRLDKFVEERHRSSLKLNCNFIK